MPKIAAERMNGRIKSLVTPQGKDGPTYGFIMCDGQPDRFIIPKAMAEGVSWDDLREGDSVTFEPIPHPKGERATNVKKADGASA